MPQICKRCLYTETHPLGIVFDDEEHMFGLPHPRGKGPA